MSKKIKLTEKQLKEITGDNDFSFLDNSDFKEFSGNREISNSGVLSSKKNGKPVTGDEVSNTLTHQTGYGLMMNRIRRNNY